MKTIIKLALIATVCLALSAAGQESSSQSNRWNFRFDIGGSMPNDPGVSEIGGPVGNGKMELSPGMQFDIALGYRLLPWLILEGELGVTANEIDSIGNWSYPDSAFTQFTMMANVMFEYPRGRLVPFAGVGAGAAVGSVSFGNTTYYSYYYSWTESDGYGSDFVPAMQVIAGLRYEFSPDWSVGVTYRFLATGNQDFDVDWWNGADFEFGVDSVSMHSVCLVFTGRF